MTRRRRREIQPWPWPGDSPLDRARRVARTYRDALERVDPELCQQLDKRARELGQTWVQPRPLAHDHDDLLTAREVADMCDVMPNTVRQWKRRGLPTVDTPDGERYRVGDVLNYHAQRRYQRAHVGEEP